MVAIRENSKAQSSTKPKFAPATLAVAILPGPIKAAVTKNPGPNPFILSPLIAQGLPVGSKSN
jgi:hypothetical protein